MDASFCSGHAHARGRGSGRAAFLRFENRAGRPNQVLGGERSTGAGWGICLTSSRAFVPREKQGTIK